MKRSRFIRTIGASGLVFASPSLFAYGNKTEPDPQLDRLLVEEFVGASHGKFDRVKELLSEFPNLINAAHDWKLGDFETGLGAASHVGYKELAQYLIDHGAQTNIFTAVLFGKTEIVKQVIEAFPTTLNVRGPHGFTLLHHAIKGGDEALEVKEYLESKGVKKTKIEIY